MSRHETMVSVRRNINGSRRPVLRRILPLLLLALFSVYQPASAAEAPLKKVSLIPIWRHQAQFAGYYMALEKGMYARHGLDVTILNGGPEQPAEEALKSGRADFAVLWLSTAMQLRSTGTQLVNLAQIVQRSSMVLVTRKTSGIRTVNDMQNRKIGVWDDGLNVPAQAFFSKYRLKMNIIPQVQNANLFLRGGVDVASTMWYNEYHTILNSGLNPDELTLFFLHDYGITFPEDGLYTLEKNYRKDPRLAEAFAGASLEGWRYACDHPDEAVELVLRYMKREKIPANRAHQKWMLARMQDLLLPAQGKGDVGRLNPADYESVGSLLCSSGVIRTVPPFQDFIGQSNVRQ